MTHTVSEQRRIVHLIQRTLHQLYFFIYQVVVDVCSYLSNSRTVAFEV